jgi:hypothetical protein
LDDTSQLARGINRSHAGILAAWFLPLFLLMGPVMAQNEKPDTQSGNFLYVFPTGWNPVEKGGTTFLYAPGSPPGTVTYIALAANDLDRNLPYSFNELWGGLKNSYRILQGGQITPLRMQHGYDALTASAVALDQRGTRWNVYVLGAQYKNRIQIVTFMSNAPLGGMLSASFEVFQKFIANLRFGDALPGAPALPADAAPVVTSREPISREPLPPGALEGIYIGLAINGTRAGARRLHFNRDGWVVKDVLQEEMIGFDFTAYRNDAKTNRSWVGRYRLDRDQINILWQDYTEDREVITRNETSPSPGINVYVPMCLCTGERFSGKYNWGLAGSGQYLQFSTDGTFLDHGMLDQMLLPNPYYEHPRTQRGTYAIQSQTMIFTFADGRRGMRTFYAPKAQEKKQLFDFIGLGWHMLYEEHYQAQP